MLRSYKRRCQGVIKRFICVQSVLVFDGGTRGEGGGGGGGGGGREEKVWVLRVEGVFKAKAMNEVNARRDCATSA